LSRVGRDKSLKAVEPQERNGSRTGLKVGLRARLFKGRKALKLRGDFKLGRLGRAEEQESKGSRERHGSLKGEKL
jgi:hypothetical protein